jgi:hypothetical protein
MPGGWFEGTTLPSALIQWMNQMLDEARKQTRLLDSIETRLIEIAENTEPKKDW